MEASPGDEILNGVDGMKILLTNDDGIYAPGIYALYEALKDEHQLDVVAPESEMSAVGHAITLNLPLRVRKIRRNKTFFGYGVTGTPADCVKIAIQELLNSPPDIILSGINLGANVGVNVLYSGTVSAATEGAFLGIRSAAISLNTLTDPDFSVAAEFSRELIRFMIDSDLKKGTALNVNVPAIPREEIAGVCLARQGTTQVKEFFDRRSDPRGNTYYWLSGETPEEDRNPDTDAVLLKQNKITMTPIYFDLTCDEELGRLKTCKAIKL